MSRLPTERERLVAADLGRQIAHWRAAATTFRDTEEFASTEAWRSVEAEVGLPLRQELGSMVEELIAAGRTASVHVARARRDAEMLPIATRAVQHFRRRFTQLETTLDFFGDAVNSRSSGPLRAALASLDRLAFESMEPVLVEAGISAPRALVYIDKGMGASILRAGIRLWTPGSVNPVAAIKIVRHNLYRPAGSLFHETGHQVAHLTKWNESIRATLETVFHDDTQLRMMWAPWASEIAADIYAFLHTGYASVCALYDVVGDSRTILRWPVGDPHPVGWLRTLLGCAVARRAFGPAPSGLWDDLEQALFASHPLSGAEDSIAALLERSRTRLADVAGALLEAPVPALGNRPMTRILDPARVSPFALAELERTAGPALWTSPHWRRAEGIRILALAGLREAQHPDTASEWIDRARTWITTQARVA